MLDKNKVIFELEIDYILEVFLFLSAIEGYIGLSEKS